MPLTHGIHTSEIAIVRIVREIAWCEFAEFWRELARPVILFDERSPANILAGEIGEFFRKWRARRDSNAGPRLSKDCDLSN